MSEPTKPSRIRKYAVPAFLIAIIAQAVYERWLHRKAVAHVRRDRKRGNQDALNEHYKRAIHDAVCRSDGKDAYTGEPLDWHLISKYDNQPSQPKPFDGHRRGTLLFLLCHKHNEVVPQPGQRGNSREILRAIQYRNVAIESGT